MTTVFRRPPPVLAGFVEAFWYVEGDLPPGRERKLPSGEMQIVVNLAEDQPRWYSGAQLDQRRTTHGAGLCGVLAGPVGIDTAEQQAVLGVSFRLGGTLPFFTEPAAALAQPVIGLDAVWGAAGAHVRERLLDQPDPSAMLGAMERILWSRWSGRWIPIRRWPPPRPRWTGDTRSAAWSKRWGPPGPPSPADSGSGSGWRPSRSPGYAGCSGCSARWHRPARAKQEWTGPKSRPDTAFSIRPT